LAADVKGFVSREANSKWGGPSRRRFYPLRCRRLR
jgi:hypothetical protein